MSDTSKSTEPRNKSQHGWNPFRKVISIVTGRPSNSSGSSDSSSGDKVIMRWTASCLNTSCPIFSRSPQFNMIYSPAPSILMFLVITLSSENAMTKTLHRLFELSSENIEEIREMFTKLNELRAPKSFYCFVRFLVDEEKTTTVSKELMSESNNAANQQVFQSIRPARVTRYLNTLTFSAVNLARPALLTTNGYGSAGLNAKWVGKTRKAGLQRFACSYHKRKMEPFFEIRTSYRRIQTENFEVIEVPFEGGSFVVLRPHFVGHLPYANRQISTEMLSKMLETLSGTEWLKGRLLLPQFHVSGTQDLWKNLMRHGVQPDLGQSQKAPPMASLWHWAALSVGPDGIGGASQKKGPKSSASQRSLETTSHGRVSGDSLFQKHKYYSIRIDSPFTYLVLAHGIPIFTGSYFGNPPPKSADLFINAPERIRQRRAVRQKKKRSKETRKQKLLRKIRKSEERERLKDKKRQKKSASKQTVSETTTTNSEEKSEEQVVEKVPEKKKEVVEQKSKSSRWKRFKNRLFRKNN